MRLNGKRGKYFCDLLAEENPDALQFTDMDGNPMYQPAIVGIAERCGQPSLLVYSARLCIQWYMIKNGVEWEAASEWFEYNTAGSWNGPGTPTILRDDHE